jgi:hypothetical protein
MSIWTTGISREDLIALSQGEQLKGKTLRTIEGFSEIDQAPLMGVWDIKSDEWTLPKLLVIPDKEKREFFAWASSYVKIKPLTAFARVIDFESLHKIAVEPPKNDRYQRAIIGMILGEAITYLDQQMSKLSLRACLGTYSFAVGKSLLRVEGIDGLNQTGQNWFRSREALGNRSTKLAIFHLQGIWSVIEQLIDPASERSDIPQIVVRCCRDLFETGDITEADWRELTKETRLYDLRIVMQDTREERVKLLEDFLKLISAQARTNVDIAFLVGYLISMIAPGTLDHWRLLEPIRNSIPTVGVWYGLCAGLRPSSRLSSYGGGIGRLVARELQRRVDILEEPTCDIAVDELDVTGPFFKAEGSTIGNTIEVEISPGVTVPFRSNGIEQELSDFRLQSTPAVQEPLLDPVTIEILDDAIYALQDVRRNLQRALPYSRRGFFKKPRKKRPTG